MLWITTILVTSALIILSFFLFKFLHTKEQSTNHSASEFGITEVVSDDLNYLKALTVKLKDTKAPLERHALLSQIVEIAFKKRADNSFAHLFDTFAYQHLSELPLILIQLKKKYRDRLPDIATFTFLGQRLRELKKYNDEINIYAMAMVHAPRMNSSEDFRQKITEAFQLMRIKKRAT